MRMIVLKFNFIIPFFIAFLFHWSPAVANGDANETFVGAIAAVSTAETLTDPVVRRAMLEDALTTIEMIPKRFPRADISVDLVARRSIGQFSLSELERNVEQEKSAEKNYWTRCSVKLTSECLISLAKGTSSAVNEPVFIAEMLIKEARAHYAHGEPRDGSRVLNAALQRGDGLRSESARTSALEKIALILFEQGQADAAESVLAKLSGLRPGNTYYQLARRTAVAGDFVEAQRLAERAGLRSGAAWDVVLERLVYYGREEEAINLSNRGLGMNPGASMAVGFVERGDIEQGLQIANSMAQRQPDRFETERSRKLRVDVMYGKLVEALAEQGEFQLAIDMAGKKSREYRGSGLIRIALAQARAGALLDSVNTVERIRAKWADGVSDSDYERIRLYEVLARIGEVDAAILGASNEPELFRIESMGRVAVALAEDGEVHFAISSLREMEGDAYWAVRSFLFAAEQLTEGGYAAEARALLSEALLVTQDVEFGYLRASRVFEIAELSAGVK